jgi:hypothetical protein
MKKIFFSFLTFIIAFFIIEFFLRLITGPINKNKVSNYVITDTYKKYKTEELDKKIKFRHKFHGGECIKSILDKEKLNWHPRIGYQTKKIDINCINSLFTNKTYNIVFFGGSVMARDKDFNFLSSIEHFAFKNEMENFRSVNFAESGARLSNSLSMFVEYISKINNINLIVFLDGINEFGSIRYNGRPDDDFFWTAGVKRRINNPESYFLDIIIDRFKTFELISKLFNYESSRIQYRKVNLSQLSASVDDYNYRKKIIKKLCNQNKLKCIFLIQPHFYSTKGLNSKLDKKLDKFIKKTFPQLEYVVQKGYEILLKNNDVYDLTEIYNNQNEIFIDDTHTNKFGAEILGKEIIKIIKSNL